MHGGDGSEVSSARNSRVTTVRSLDVTDNESTKDQPPKLCGFLNKLAGKGPLRGFKTRWFVYDPRKCYLYYFKTPQDSLPLGHIEIADACFSYEVDAGDEGQFEIHASGNDFILKAPNRQVMRYWLQQLQQKRWEFCNARGAARDSWNSPTLPDLPTGLVAKDTDAFSYEKPSDSTESVRNEFAMEIAPEGLVGVNAARNPAAQPSTINFSLKQWGTELRNSMSHLRAGRGSSENRRSVFLHKQ